MGKEREREKLGRERERERERERRRRRRRRKRKRRHFNRKRTIDLIKKQQYTGTAAEKARPGYTYKIYQHVLKEYNSYMH